MLIQITNRCHMGCPHCMQDSTPRGRHMTDEVFNKVLDLCKEARPMIVSLTGGEPTEHPQWAAMAKALLAVPSVAVLAIITNGAWIEDDEQRLKMARLIRESRGRVKVQVYSNPMYYKDHDWTVGQEARFRSIGCLPDFHSPIYMQGLGRARKNCAEEVAQSDHVPSCINSHLIARQAHSLNQFLSMAAHAAKFCRPLIDPAGGVHMSESWLCQTVADVGDGAVEVFRKMRQSRPCRGCRNYENFERRFPKEMEMLNS